MMFLTRWKGITRIYQNIHKTEYRKCCSFSWAHTFFKLQTATMAKSHQCFTRFRSLTEQTISSIFMEMNHTFSNRINVMYKGVQTSMEMEYL